MRPKNPERVTIDSGRLTIPGDWVPQWFDVGNPQDLRMVPLLWRRSLALPSGHQLDAWILWCDQDPADDWVVDPRDVLANDQGSGNAYYLASLMHEATLGLSDRKCRLSCTGLFKYLVGRGGEKLWLTDERTSIGVMTEFAYHCAYGQLRL
jgi:hypothetical protein